MNGYDYSLSAILQDSHIWLAACAGAHCRSDEVGQPASTTFPPPLGFHSQSICTLGTLTLLCPGRICGPAEAAAKYAGHKLLPASDMRVMAHQPWTGRRTRVMPYVPHPPWAILSLSACVGCGRCTHHGARLCSSQVRPKVVATHAVWRATSLAQHASLYTARRRPMRTA